MEIPPPKYFWLRPGGEVRLKYAYIIKCDEVVKDDAGNIAELRCTVDLDSKSGGPTASRKVKGNDSLGERGTRNRCGSPIVRSAFHCSRAGFRLRRRLRCDRAGARLQIFHEFEFTGSGERQMRLTLRLHARKSAINLSASAISRSIQIRRRNNKLGIVQPRSGTLGQRNGRGSAR